MAKVGFAAGLRPLIPLICFLERKACSLCALSRHPTLSVKLVVVRELFKDGYADLADLRQFDGEGCYLQFLPHGVESNEVRGEMY